jgi:hypothetical protein
MVDKVALGHVFLRVLLFPCVQYSIGAPYLHATCGMIRPQFRDIVHPIDRSNI